MYVDLLIAGEHAGQGDAADGRRQAVGHHSVHLPPAVAAAVAHDARARVALAGRADLAGRGAERGYVELLEVEVARREGHGDHLSLNKGWSRRC